MNIVIEPINDTALDDLIKYRHAEIIADYILAKCEEAHKAGIKYALSEL